MRLQDISPQFVEFIPRQLDEGVIYISERFKTASHLCPCGCRTKVVTPFSPVEWQLHRQSQTVSLYPSIGNWSDACQSHYFIRRNRILWAGRMSAEKIALVKAKDKADKDRQISFANKEKDREQGGMEVQVKAPSPRQPLNAWHAVLLWLRR
jgi:Family of unknown function (DUF6527)